MSIAPESILQQKHARFNRLMPIVAGMAHSMRPTDEDMEQAGLLKLWQMISYFSEKEDRYLIASVRHHMINHVRDQNLRIRTQKILAVFTQDGEDFGGHEVVHGSVDVDDVLNLLSQNQRKAFQLRYLFDFTTEQTAKKMNCSERKVRYLVAQAKKILQRELLSD